MQLSRDEIVKLEEIFTPHAVMQRKQHIGRGYRFVHYTSADSALKIVKSKRMWLRNVTCMSDYKEVEHGLDMLNLVLKKQGKDGPFMSAIASVGNGLLDDAIALFNRWLPVTRGDTYIACLSEYWGDVHDERGRLSMWRAFGQGPRVAIVLRPPIDTSKADPLNVVFSPVAYLEQDDVSNVFLSVTDAITKNLSFLRSLKRESIVDALFRTFLASALCLKHPGFHEEREWRLMYLPKRDPSPLLRSKTESIGGVPQLIYEMPIDKSASAQLADIDLPKIIEKIIIGPTDYPTAVYEAFAAELTNIGVPDPKDKIKISNIPLRA